MNAVPFFKIIGTMQNVESCILAVTSDPSSSLEAFVVPKCEMDVPVVTHESLSYQLRNTLPDYSLPDRITLVKYLPMTDHGNYLKVTIGFNAGH